MKKSLAFKISLGQAVSFLCFILFSAFVFFFLTSLRENNLKAIQTNFYYYNHAQKNKLYIVQIQQFISDIGATRGEDGLDDGLKEAENNYNNLLKNIAEVKIQAQNQKNEKQISSMEEIKKLAGVYYETGVKMANLYMKEGTKAGNIFMPNFDKASSELQEKANESLTEATENFKKELSLIEKKIRLLLSLATWIPPITLIIFSFFSFKFITGLTSQLKTVSTELDSKIPQLLESADSMNSLSTELSSCATEQAAAVQETAASIEEIAAMVSRNSDNAGNAKESSHSSQNSVKSGQDALSQMMTAIEEINKNNDAFTKFMTQNNIELNEMVQVITTIADKTTVINDIVFQTKLLSFNASVEAARAGEHGKGFAVVAEEIGNLAEMSGTAASDIKTQLDQSILKVNKIVTETKSQVEAIIFEGKEKIKKGIEKANSCNMALKEIDSTSQMAASLVSEVAHASKEQSQGIAEVNKAMAQIDEVTNQNTIASEGVSGNASQVMDLLTSINGTIEKLNKIIHG